MEWEISEMFKVLAVETRVKMLELLKTQGPLGAKEIARLLGISPAAASQHLKILKQAGLVRSERQGYWKPYAVNPEALEKYRRILVGSLHLRLPGQRPMARTRATPYPSGGPGAVRTGPAK